MIAVNWNIVALAAALFFYGMLAAVAMRSSIGTAWRRLKALPRMVQTFMAVMALVATVEAQKQGDAPQRGAGMRRLALANPAAPAPTVSPEEIAQGYRLVSVTNEHGYSFAMPTNAVCLGNLHLHGARSDFGRNVVDLDGAGGEPTGWMFPYGPGDAATSAFWRFMDGRLQTAPRNPSFAVSAGLGDTLAMQGESRLWALADGEARIITWERFFAGGDTNTPVNAQIALYANGDFTIRSNDVLRAYSRIDPNDWDGDGLDNAIDASPVSSDGDCFGTGVAWLNANCGAVLAASPDAAGETVGIDWSTNANGNAYYWLSFTALHDRTRVTIVCDGPSNLGDMVVIANEGQACEAPLLIGACYRVTANRPIGNISASDPVAEIRLDEPMRLLRNAPPAGCGPGAAFEVERPLAIGFDGNGDAGRITCDPDIGAVIGSIAGNCCSVECTASNYVWECDWSCDCTGYSQLWQVTALWEGYSRVFDWTAQCRCQAENEADPESWFSLDCPAVIVKDGNPHTVSGSFNPPCETNATLTLSCIAGSGKISVLDSGGDWQRIQGAAKSDSVGDVVFGLTLSIGAETYCVTQSLTVAEAVRMDVSSDVQGESPNPPPFMTGVDYPFSVTNSPLPDKHLVVPFCNVATLGEDGFEVADFTVGMNLVLEPQGVDASSLPCEWEIVEALPQMSGALSHSGGISAHFANPKQGGVYRFRARCDGSPWTEANIVLPLCGASIDGVFDADMTLVATVMQTLRDVKTWYQKQDPDFGTRWFYDHNVVDYVGRVDNALRPTVWRYNQISDAPGSEYYRMGAVAMFRGIPTPISKLGNFIAGYGTEVVGVWRILRWASQILGTRNDATSWMSWHAGEDFASSGSSNLVERTSSLAADMWRQVANGGTENKKVFMLWSNPVDCDNYIRNPEPDFDYNRHFTSPGIIHESIQTLQPTQNQQ